MYCLKTTVRYSKYCRNEIPRRFQSVSLDEAVREHNALIPLYKKLAKEIKDEDRVNVIDTMAYKLAGLEAENSSSIGALIH